MARKTNKKLSLELEGQADPKTSLDWQQFLASAKPVMKLLKDDLRARAKSSSSVAEAVKARHEAERDQKRTADSFIEWQDHFVEQVAAAWMLSCVFVRTLEDRGLLGHARLAGPGASDSLKLFLELAPSLNERDYLLTIFRELTRFAATKDLFDARHNPIWLLTPSAEGAKALVRLFQQPRADLPAFRFGQSDTGFLGWIYQDLDEDVRARFALLQTPRFVESFILDRTLEPAIERFGLDDTTLIDPTCGSGHFLLGAFERLFAHRLEKEPGIGAREAAKKALDAVYGADLNPYAVAIARFRLTLAFFDKAGFARLTEAPAPPLHVVVADSLLHNPHLQQGELGDLDQSAKLWKGDEFALENEAEARAVLYRQFGAVVGNPPYITVKDVALRERYRGLYPRSAAGKYSIAAPFTERFFQLARDGGRVGMITANSFMKREFGKKLIEQYLPTVNLDLVINTSGAYIPGHGTPTVLLFGASESARGGEVSTVLASRGEPSTPDDPEQGLVWRSIADHWSEFGFENEYISVAKTAREALSKHPWSLGGGGAAELKELLEERGEKRLGEVVDDIGLASFTGLDDAFILPISASSTRSIEQHYLRPMVTGEDVRDWDCATELVAISPYSEVSQEPRALDEGSIWGRHLWLYRTSLKNVLSFGGRTRAQVGDNWWEWYRWQADRYRLRFRIVFAFVATHNHFVLDRGTNAFNRSAPIVVLPPSASEGDHLELLGYLNSSVACFWMKQVSHMKGTSAYNRSTQDEPARVAFEFSGTQLNGLPLPQLGALRARIADLAEALAARGAKRAQLLREALPVLRDTLADDDGLVRLKRTLGDFSERLQQEMVWLQEEIDWTIYVAFGFCDDTLLDTSADARSLVPLCPPGARPFEISLALGGRVLGIDGQKLANSVPASFSPETSRIWSRRISSLMSEGSIAVLERPEFKRRWFITLRESAGRVATFADAFQAAVDRVMADNLESLCSSTGHVQRRNALFRSTNWSVELEVRGIQVLAANAVPFLSLLRFADAGREKRSAWERCWAAQREEDAGQDPGAILQESPPKYDPKDYSAMTYWQLRGPLDVPKERFISYPGCESDQDHEPVYGWAGWNHEQRAKALATLYWNRKTEESWAKDRLTPMLAGLLELLPWLKQWHSAPSDEYAGESAANYYAGFLDGECRALGLTHEDLRAWRPDPKARGKKAATKPVDEVAADAPKPAPKKRAKKAASEDRT